MASGQPLNSIWRVPGRVALVRELADQELRANDIAEEVSKRWEITVTKNSIIGLCQRNKIKLKKNGLECLHEANRKRHLEMKLRRKPKPLPKMTTRQRIQDKIKAAMEYHEIKCTPVAGSHPVRLIELKSSDCRWPLDRDQFGNRQFCGAKKMIGQYCLYHYQQSIKVMEKAA